MYLFYIWLPRINHFFYLLHVVRYYVSNYGITAYLIIKLFLRKKILFFFVWFLLLLLFFFLPNQIIKFLSIINNHCILCFHTKSRNYNKQMNNYRWHMFCSLFIKTSTYSSCNIQSLATVFLTRLAYLNNYLFL